MSKKASRQNAKRHAPRPRDLERWLERAGQRLLAADYPGVLTTAGRVLSAPIASPEQRVAALHHLGAAHMMLQQYDAAYTVVTAALALDPDDAVLWYNRGMAARYTMRFGQSRRDFEQAAALDGDGVLAAKLAEALPLARSLADDGRALRGPHCTLDHLIEQEELFQQAVQRMEQHHWAEAESLFRQVIAMGDVLPQPQGNLGLCLMMQRQFDAAEMALRRALEIDPDYTIARQNLAGLPTIRATGKLPAMRMNRAFEGQPLKQTLSFLVEGETR